jgi:nicotinamide-nucleotide amidase
LREPSASAGGAGGGESPEGGGDGPAVSGGGVISGTGEGSPLPPRAAIVSVGDELLLGETVDTNGTWLARELSDLGFRVVRRWVVGDAPGDIREGVGEAVSRADVLVVTGGLGPTPDDRTLSTVAGLLGRGLRTDTGVLSRLEERFRARGLGSLPEEARAMARVPDGARVLANARGSAPGIALETGGGGLCILLPGVPAEMRGIFSDQVAPLLRERFSSRLEPVAHRLIHTTGIPESLLAREVARLELPLDSGVSMAFLPDLRGVRLRLTARGAPGDPGVQAALAEMEERLEPVVAPFRYRSEAGDLAESLGQALLSRRMTLATAESCTGGLVAKRMTDHPGSSSYFLGAVVAYANDVKETLLGVSPALLEEKGAVSREVAEAMASGVAARFGSTAGVGITGVAGPGGGTAEKPVGTVWIAASVGGEVASRRELFAGPREDVRERGAQAAMALLFWEIQGRGSPS